jgi:hypothetical protein
MTRFYGIRERRFINWAQKNTCLLCSYPLALNKHLHHIIARDDGGPDHYLNIVALCPNHHWLVERIKRQIISNQGSSSIDWLETGQAALHLYNELSEETRHTLDILSKPHRLSGVIRGGVPEHLLEKAAYDLMMEDARLLHDINKKRPRIFLPLGSNRIPDDSADTHVDKLAAQVGSGFYSEVISAHMERLNLPYKAFLKESEPNESIHSTR